MSYVGGLAYSPFNAPPDSEGFQTQVYSIP